MQLFIMRHGQAHQYGAADAERELTEQGFLEASVMAKWLKSSGIIIDQLYVSPFTRAQQTATTVYKDAGLSCASKTLDFITPSGSAMAVHDYIDGVVSMEKFDAALIVSHMPLVSYLVEQLTHDKQSPIFQTAAIAHIDYDVKKMKGELVKLIAPYDLC